MGTRRSLAQNRKSMGIEAMDHVAHHLVVAAHLESNLGHSFSASRSGQDLAAAQDKGIGRTQSCLDLALFVFDERSDKNGRSHILEYTTLSIPFRGNALGKAHCCFNNRKACQQRMLEQHGFEQVEVEERPASKTTTDSSLRCTGKTKSGLQCQAKASSSGYCNIHDPAKIAERSLRMREQEAELQAQKKAY